MKTSQTPSDTRSIRQHRVVWRTESAWPSADDVQNSPTLRYNWSYQRHDTVACLCALRYLVNTFDASTSMECADSAPFRAAGQQSTTLVAPPVDLYPLRVDGDMRVRPPIERPCLQENGLINPCHQRRNVKVEQLRKSRILPSTVTCTILNHILIMKTSVVSGLAACAAVVASMPTIEAAEVMAWEGDIQLGENITRKLQSIRLTLLDDGR